MGFNSGFKGLKVDFYTKVSRKCKFFKNRLSDTHTLVRGEKDFTFILAIFFD